MPKERNKADGYREKAYEGDTKAMNRSTSGRLLPTGRKNLGVSNRLLLFLEPAKTGSKSIFL